MKKINRFNRLYLIILLLYSFLIILLSFSSTPLDYIVMTFTYLLSYVFSDVTSISIVIEYIILSFVYLGLGILSTLFFIELFDTNLYIITYSILVPLGILVLSMLIMSFFEDINLFKYLFRFLWIIVGFMIVYLITYFKVKKVSKNKNGEEE